MRIISKKILRSAFHIQTCLKLSNGDKEARIKTYYIAIGSRYCQIDDRPWRNHLCRVNIKVNEQNG
jgi:hypothetical protein